MLLFFLAACGLTTHDTLADQSAPTAQKPVVTSLRLDPHVVALAPRAQLQLRIVVKWSDGATIVPALLWAVEGGEVSARGLYTAASDLGTYRVIVTLESGTLADTAVVTVTPGAPPPAPPPPPPGPPPGQPPAPGAWNEPAGYLPIVGRHFNSVGTVPSSGRGMGSFPWKTTGSEGWDDAEGRFPANIKLAQDESAPLSPPGILHLRYPPHVVAKGTYSPGVSQMIPITTLKHYGQVRHYSKFYFRTAFRVSANWQGHPTGSNKMFFLRSTASPEPIIRLRGAGAGALALNVDLQGSEGAGGDPRAATGGLNPNTAGATGAGAWAIVRGRWYVLEGVFEIGADDQRNGVVKLWLDGVLTHHYEDVEFQKTATKGTVTWGYIHIAPTWGGGGGTINQLMWLDFDDFYVSGAP